MSTAILVAGIGNIFLGDDGFGVEVAWSLGRSSLPEGVAVRDYGIRGFDLAYALLEPWNTVILVDALARGNAPGTITLLEPDLSRLDEPATEATALDPHSMDPLRVLHLAASMGSISARVLIVGCEPLDFGDELEGRMGLSAPVQAAVQEAAKMVEELIGRILRNGMQGNGTQHPLELQTMER